MADTEIGFFAFPYEPSLEEHITNAIREIKKQIGIDILSWTDLAINGRFLITTICEEIDRRDLFCADLSNLNPNVLFELGYAIAKEKKIWLIRDTGIPQHEQNFKKMGCLTTVGYLSYTSSEDISKAFFKQRPHLSTSPTLYDEIIKPHISESERKSLLYLKSLHDSDPSKRATQYIQDSCSKHKVDLIIDDPNEAAYQPLHWYTKRISKSAAVICHYMQKERFNSLIHNARYSLIAGLAYGLGKNVHMMIQGDELGPADYRDMLTHYITSTQLTTAMGTWLPSLCEQVYESNLSAQKVIRNKQTQDIIKLINLGDYLAENEERDLIDNYFLETAEFRNALIGKSKLILGKKGAGKTACYLKLRSMLTEDPRNIVTSLMPHGYELNLVLEATSRFQRNSTKGGIMECIWKILIYSEILNTLTNELSERNPATYGLKEKNIIQFHNSNVWMREDFPRRLDSWISEFLDQEDQEDIRLSERLHRELIPQLRQLVIDAHSNKTKKIVFLIDNLDKAWDKQNQIELLSQFILALLSSSSRIKTELHKDGNIEFQPIIFLREDIFREIEKSAREPDKLAESRIQWDDKEMLFRIAHARLNHSVNKDRTANIIKDAWEFFFSQQIRGVETTDYIYSIINKRPRDLLFWLDSAINIAINRGHHTITEDDLSDAESEYSQFAFSALKVELIHEFEKFEEFSIELMGHSREIGYDDLISILKRIQVSDTTETIELLILSGFLLYRVDYDEFRRVEDKREMKKIAKLAEVHGIKANQPITFSINPAYSNYLELSNDSKGQQLLLN